MNNNQIDPPDTETIHYISPEFLWTECFNGSISHSVWASNNQSEVTCESCKGANHAS